MSDTHDNYTLAHPVAAEGSRIGLVTCRKCGVTLTLDMELDVMLIHDEWHRAVSAGSDGGDR